MARPRYGRMTKRETALERRSNDLHYALLSGKPPQFANEIVIPDAPKKRVAKPGDESDVQSQIMKWLKGEPRVAFRIRVNSGAPGSTIYKSSYGLPVDELLSDILGQLRGGQLFAIECKREGWTHPTDERERKQAKFHGTVRANGGIAFFAASLDEAKQKLDAALT